MNNSVRQSKSEDEANIYTELQVPPAWCSQSANHTGILTYVPLSAELVHGVRLSLYLKGSISLH